MSRRHGALTLWAAALAATGWALVATAGHQAQAVAAPWRGLLASAPGAAMGAHARPWAPARPRRVAIPFLGVDAPVTRLGRAPDGRLETPVQPTHVGWWAGGPPPGGAGAAVLAAHVDSHDGPAVFTGLHALRPGHEIHVIDARGTRIRFAVRRLERHAKTAFPTQRVYGAAQGAQLRMVTCAGRFDPVRRHYADNLVVFAERL
ncbi:MAG TPA: class F sortase [Solirubrobacteraceae bacterium]|nr:class F sortase [Solirubrobacteraceae bacterium]